MRKIETEGIVESDGRLIMEVRLPDYTPGKYKIVMSIDEIQVKEKLPFKFPTIDIEWPLNLSLSRKDLYDERGR